MSPLTLLHNATVFDPQKLGVTDVLVGGGSILAVGAELNVEGIPGAAVVDLTGKTLVPGLVDGHLHQVGGCGLQGYASRAPELWTGELAMAGITTSVAAPGMDMLTKNMESVLAKVYALESDGLTAFAFLGGGRRPYQTLTDSIRKDLFLIEKLIGVKVFLGQGAASRYSNDELIDLASELEWSARTTSKACLLHAHLGETEDPAAQLLFAIKKSQAAPDRFQATHGNYTEHTMAASVELAKAGCAVDLNPLLDPRAGVMDAIGVQEALPRLLQAGVDPSMLTMSTDGNANVPRLRPDGSRGPYVKNLGSLWGATVELVSDFGMKLDDVLPLVTSNPARVLQLAYKGRIQPGSDADLLVLDGTLQIVDVYAKGKHFVADGQPLIESMYEQHPAEAYPYPALAR
ncbi:beta-aspartyl-dipeptidase (metallo-type) [Arthrobacter silviterrae]|uniref:Beta-aspartyl-peptidase n=1 Tax=Arthrobacter silviterrae TaxID=2026658 RepID=A0ABX0DCS3_9MICC|nr:amidohydrolase family protein [Arthrobacter silviterrae]MDQ0276450.1 beta-aspartyl-dipeptidase (metallo-type) [Arthrobacter silviterrae]NGN84712.1 beta-aspartyl-peptidase [Arthrobacter silviterrae]